MGLISGSRHDEMADELQMQARQSGKTIHSRTATYGGGSLLIAEVHMLDPAWDSSVGVGMGAWLDNPDSSEEHSW